MSKYLNVFNTLAEYQAFSASTEYVQPNVALVKETNVLYYDYGDNKPQADMSDYKVATKSLVSDGGNTYGLDEMLYVNYYPSGITHPSFIGIKRIDISNMPNTVTSLEDTFSGNTKLIEITGEIPSAVENMSQTFYNCQSLVNAPSVIPNSVTNMYRTFYNCKSLVNFPSVIPSGVTSLKDTFYTCYRLKNAPEIPSGVTSLYNTFSYCGLVTVQNIPESVTDMKFAFSNCSSLVNVPPIPSGVTEMMYIFFGCSSLKEVTFLNTTPTSYSSILSECSKLETIYVPDESVDAYKTASGWSQFADKIKPLSEKPSE